MDVSLPGPAFLAVEHPGKVRNLDRALATLGGPIALRSMADDPTSSTLELRFRPEDRFEHPVVSTTARTNNILIKVVREETPDGRSVQVWSEPVGAIKYTVRFRDIADFQWNTSKSPFVQRLTQALAVREGSVKSTFVLSREDSPGPCELDILPPPVFSTTVVPHSYNYLQNPAAKKIQTDSGPRLINRTRGLRQHLLTAAFEDTQVPGERSAKLPDQPAAEIATIIAKLELMFAERPMWTRRGIVNTLNETTNNFYNIKFALPYVSYKWKSGPWRDCYAKFKLDPRSDPKYANYQAIYCLHKGSMQAETTNEELPRSNSHIFDGITLFPVGRKFMFEDMTDPILLQIRSTVNKRERPHPRDGWWRASTMEATRTILKGKLQSLCSGIVPSDLDYTDALHNALASPGDEEDEDHMQVDDLDADAEDDDLLGEEDQALEPDQMDLSVASGDIDVRVRRLMHSLIRPDGQFDNDNRPNQDEEVYDILEDDSSEGDLH